jgi:hypothetical protein
MFYYDLYSVIITIIIKIKSVAYSSQGNHTGQLDCNWLADGSMRG